MDMTEGIHSLQLGREEEEEEEEEERTVGYDFGSSIPKEGNTSLATSD